MFAASRFFHRLPPLSPPFALPALRCAAAAMATLSPAVAQGTHLWTQSQMEEFEKGTPEGVAIESDGHLRQRPGADRAAHHSLDLRVVVGCG